MENYNINRPSYCCLAVLESCFMHCRMCYKWKTDINFHPPGELNLRQWKQVIDDFATLSNKNTFINFAGGEPLAREETLELITHASKLNLDTILATNAYLINNREMAMKIHQSGLKNISISLDGMRSQTHDFLRGMNDSYDRVIQAIELLNKYAPNAEINLCTIISGVNISEILEIVKWASSDYRIKGIGFQAITQPFSSPEEEYWYQNPEYEALWPKDIEKVELVIDELIRLITSNELRSNFHVRNPLNQLKIYRRYFRNPHNFIKIGECHLYKQALNITPIGEVHICFYKPSIGNIKNDSLDKLWFSEKAKTVRKQIKECRRNCQALVNCNFDEQEEYVN